MRRLRPQYEAGGWIITTARNRAIDTLRRSKRSRELVEQAVSTTDPARFDAHGEDSTVHDDQLRLIFTCCHPALSPEHQVALTLRLLGGLTVNEVARAFLVGLLKDFIGVVAGNARVPQKFFAGEFKLGSWVNSRRLDYRAGRLSPARIAELEALPGWTWDARENP